GFTTSHRSPMLPSPGIDAPNGPRSSLAKTRSPTMFMSLAAIDRPFAPVLIVMLRVALPLASRDPSPVRISPYVRVYLKLWPLVFSAASVSVWVAVLVELDAFEPG